MRSSGGQITIMVMTLLRDKAPDIDGGDRITSNACSNFQVKQRFEAWPHEMVNVTKIFPGLNAYALVACALGSRAAH